ncbi:FtsX-like permease family protein [Nocardioides sp. B-3]|uniref:FtsX-like permease family protein n=1 Tax=Nocardioides sp. B-3 TaxID=2895565 RepID=UPI0021529FB7|nr:ABC transporter permease [Nocardioides sp. B-3]UUZ57790.1 ABC transporter permease [Nocardioides sp. B-3]
MASTVGDVVVRPAGTDAASEPTTRTVDSTLVDELEGVEGAARVDGNVTAFGVYVVGKDGKLIGGNGPPSIGGNWSEAPAGHDLEGMDIIAGREPEKQGEVLLDSRTAGEGGYVIGQDVNIVTATDRGALTAELVGIIGFPEGGSLNGATFTAFDTRTARELFLDGKDAFTDIWVTAEAGTSRGDLAEAVTAALPDGVEAVTGDDAADEAASAIREAVGFLTTFLLIFAGISLVVGAFLIVNTFSIPVAQRSRELALLRAPGASKKQVTRSVLLEALVPGLLGSTIGLGLGVLLAVGIRSLFAQFGLDLSGQSLIMAPKTIPAAYAVGVIVTMGAAFFPARRTTKIAPVQAMRDDIAMPESSLRRRFLIGVVLMLGGGAALAAGLTDSVPRPLWFVGGGIPAILLGVASASPVISHPLLSAAAWIYARLFGSIGALAGQNSLRNPRRTTATSSALMIGLSPACTMAIVGDSAKASVDRTIEENFVGDYVVSSLVGQSFSTRIGREMADVPGVESVWAQRFAISQMGGEGQGIGAADPATMRDGFKIDMVEGDLSDSGRRHGRRRRDLCRGGGARGRRRRRGSARRRGARDGGRRFVRREPTALLPDRDHPADPGRRGPPGLRQLPDHRHRWSVRRAGRPRRGRGEVADRHRQGPAGLRCRATRADRPAGVDDLRAARARAVHRGAGHRQHARVVHHRAHARGRAATGDRSQPAPAAADGDPRSRW